MPFCIGYHTPIGKSSLKNQLQELRKSARNLEMPNAELMHVVVVDSELAGAVIELVNEFEEKKTE